MRRTNQKGKKTLMNITGKQQSVSQSLMEDTKYKDQYRPNLFNLIKNFRKDKVNENNKRKNKTLSLITTNILII